MRQHPLHQEWLEAQAQAAEYRRLTAELNAYANPNPAQGRRAEGARDAGHEAPRAQGEREMKKHTPGPWKFGKELGALNGEWLVSLDAGSKGRGIAIAETRTGPSDRAEPDDP